MARRIATTLAVVALVLAAVAFAVRFVPIVNRPLLVIAALAPYLMLGAPVAVLVFAALRRWGATLLAVALTAAVVAVQAPLYSADDAPAGVTVRFASVNLRYGEADATAVVTLAREQVDVLAVQELTPQLAENLAELGADFPFQVLQPRDGPAGVGIWSRYPMRAGTSFDEFWLGLLTARVRIPGAAAETTVVTTHLSAPWPDPFEGWRQDVTRLPTVLQQIAADAPGAVLVAGDLNSTPDMREFRALLRDGYHDAAEQAGAGLTRTHPADIAVPPVFAVDHILTRDATATSVRTVAVPGSDHRALIAEIVLPELLA
ncbi:endonuclease/exonuclease/phosphatase family protein [Mycolicibacterium flavescens]|uniref:Metal-dependent hydrolase n=1 Tax=Mycolicibacterium flavescens TaxID=1776 RepID=A0A1E3RLR0_MYCFV|nr:endonuclease/exonuclease/phosphatase family protein [Mycolicibacterium flavescens]MCV7281824.1 endonuclease/exonuclease/phosphatase family protein [Mycolicibacterium flavescens]ODQ90794.1 metal-dependent hydrolase [Mycolicibacterium flavescens]